MDQRLNEVKHERQRTSATTASDAENASEGRTQPRSQLSQQCLRWSSQSPPAASADITASARKYTITHGETFCWPLTNDDPLCEAISAPPDSVRLRRAAKHKRCQCACCTCRIYLNRPGTRTSQPVAC